MSAVDKSTTAKLPQRTGAKGAKWKSHAIVARFRRDGADAAKAVSPFEEGVTVGLSDATRGNIKRLGFLCGVLLPTLIGAIYYGLIATDRYVSETRFVVRSISGTPIQQRSEQASGIPGGIPSSLDQDAYIIESYLKSHAFYEELDRRLDFDALYAGPGIDFFSRLGSDANSDDKAKYISRRLTTFVDGPSGIVTFQAQAFSAEDAETIVQTALDLSGAVIDEVSERAKQDLVARAEREVRESLDRFVVTLSALRDYQNETGILDPTGDAKIISELIGGLTQKKLETDVRLQTSANLGVSDSAQQRQLTLVSKALENQIDELRQSLTRANRTEQSLSGALVRFAELQTERLLAEALYEAARNALDTANSAALRRSAFLAVFSPPSQPENAAAPKRLQSVMIIFFATFVIWATAILTIAAVEDHME
ncbi:MAG: hypothetical protein AAFY73_04285 [Pseudomonadota bacterium]